MAKNIKKVVKKKSTVKNTVKTKKKRNTDGLIPWEKGQSGNIEGRPQGSLNVSTKYELGFNKLIADNKGTMTKEDIQAAIFGMALKRAMLGDYKFFNGYVEHVYGKSVQKNINLDIDIQDDEINQKANEAVRRFMGINQSDGDTEQQGQEED